MPTTLNRHWVNITFTQVIIQVTEQCQKKHTTLHSAAITGCKLPSATMSTIDVTLNWDVTAVEQPTNQSPDTFSIMDMTEKVVDPVIK